MVSDPLTKYMFCSPSEGGAALVLASERKMRELGAQGNRGASPVVRSRVRGSFEVFSPALAARRSLGDAARGHRGVRNGRLRPEDDRRRAVPGHGERRRSHAHGRKRLLRRR